MREIKFRVWDDYNKCMWPVYGYRQGAGGIIQAIATEPSQDTDKWTWGAKALSPLMQYTGLKDKNSVEIYEGDIIQQDEQRYEVAWHIGDAQFGLNVLWSSSEPPYIHSSRVPLRDWRWISTVKTDKDNNWDRNNPETVYTVSVGEGWKGRLAPIEVIGNIYENPELLQSSHEV